MNSYQDNSSRNNACRSGMPLVSCPAAGISGNYPIGMGYVPVQTWQQPYTLETAFRRGTIFPALDLPFMMGGAC